MPINAVPGPVELAQTPQRIRTRCCPGLDASPWRAYRAIVGAGPRGWPGKPGMRAVTGESGRSLAAAGQKRLVGVPARSDTRPAARHEAVVEAMLESIALLTEPAPIVDVGIEFDRLTPATRAKSSSPNKASSPARCPAPRTCAARPASVAPQLPRRPDGPLCAAVPVAAAGAGSSGAATPALCAFGSSAGSGS